jgi:integration host factor subunit alpha
VKDLSYTSIGGRIHFFKGDLMTLTKKKIINNILMRTELDKETASNGFETFNSIIVSSLTNGEDVSLSGFGRFHVREKLARRGCNPKTGAEMIITPRRTITFSLSKALKARLENNEEE